MEKMKKSQILKLFLISALCIIAPLISTSFRPKYLYFIVNILIFAVGAESGLASFFLEAPENKKPAQKSSEVYPDNETWTTISNNGISSLDHSTNKTVKVFEKSSSEKIADTVKVQKVLDKSPSTPSLFFIGAADEDCTEEHNDDDNGEETGELSEQELYHKAETFIGDFHNQLKMQREESWKKLRDIYQKAF
ncbi:Hypothetical predicted protein [Olea europaea subsp. europaea]|uniref:DUF4408 domain-containing protein n=1 Tax=Olea europaea subsp. europaea TaxID=158383 RepID=A0A8S0T449_OLEEU|nr:Hypothetical predicted protein [Olea europaea subsp. europaea]